MVDRCDKVCVASRRPYRLVFAASMSASISVGVRCSRLRNSELGRRDRSTARFAPVGGMSLRCDFAVICRLPSGRLLGQYAYTEQFASVDGLVSTGPASDLRASLIDFVAAEVRASGKCSDLTAETSTVGREVQSNSSLISFRPQGLFVIGTLYGQPGFRPGFFV
jgi:hypothetical protein